MAGQESLVLKPRCAVPGKGNGISVLIDNNYAASISLHYKRCWGATPALLHWERGPVHELPSDFGILEFPPKQTAAWIYATCCMSQPEDEKPVEIHLYSPRQCYEHVELLTVIAHYHRTGHRLDLGHTVNFGRSWLPGSACEYGLISLPYLDGPDLEIGDLAQASVGFYWLIPVTREEVEFKKRYGLEALEQRFEDTPFNYMDPKREGVA